MAPARPPPGLITSTVRQGLREGQGGKEPIAVPKMTCNMVEIINIGPLRHLWGFGNQWSFAVAALNSVNQPSSSKSFGGICCFRSNCTREFSILLQFSSISEEFPIFFHKSSPWPRDQSPVSRQRKNCRYVTKYRLGVIIFPGPAHIFKYDQLQFATTTQFSTWWTLSWTGGGHEGGLMQFSNEDRRHLWMTTCKSCLINLQKNGEPSIQHVQESTRRGLFDVVDVGGCLWFVG